ncbi:MAG: DMT family transporter [Polyangiaceae bacterium]
MTDARDDAQRGIPYLVGAAFGFSLMSLLVKRAGRDLPVEMLVLARGVVTFVISAGLLRRHRLSPWGNDKKRLVLRGVLGTGGLACFFYAVTVLPLAEVTVIHYLNPVLTAVLAALLLREPIGLRLVTALVIAILGTVLVAQPPFLFGGASDLPLPGVLAALGGATFSAGAYVTVRRVTQTDHPLVVVFYFPLVAVPVLLPFALRAWIWPTPTGWLLLLGIGVVTQISQVLLTEGLARVPAGRGTAVGYVQIVFATLLGLLFFAEVPTATTIAGALLIVAATASLWVKAAPRS